MIWNEIKISRRFNRVYVTSVCVCVYRGENETARFRVISWSFGWAAAISPPARLTKHVIFNGKSLFLRAKLAYFFVCISINVNILYEKKKNTHDFVWERLCTLCGFSLMPSLAAERVNQNGRRAFSVRRSTTAVNVIN